MTDFMKKLSRSGSGKWVCLAASLTGFLAAAAVVLTCDEIPDWLYEINDPINVWVTDSSANSITISWNGISGIPGYNIYRREGAIGTYSKIDNTHAPTYKNTGLQANKTYYYRVAAYNRVGKEGASPGTAHAMTYYCPSTQAGCPGFVRQFTVQFNTDGGKPATIDPITVDSGKSIGASRFPSNPMKSDNIFAGWFDVNTQYTASTVIVKNVTLKAEWTPDATQTDPCDANPQSDPSCPGYVEPPPTGETFVDNRDSKTYKKVTIGTQTWMAENLNYAASGSKCGDGSYLSENNTKSCDDYGRLYNWATAMAIDAKYNSSYWNESDVKHRGVCPAGWHIPSDREWDMLMVAVGGVRDGNYWRGAGTKLKSSTGWNSYSGVPKGTDEYGFSALPGGYGYSDGNFYYVGGYGRWWSATEDDASYAWYRNMDYGNEIVDRYNDDKSNLFSVRCLQD